jgi:hypothetical protein
MAVTCGERVVAIFYFRSGEGKIVSGRAGLWMG